MTTPKVILFYAIFLSLFISCSREATNAKPGEKRIALVRAASGTYYIASCLKEATEETLEDCEAPVGGKQAVGGRGIYGAYPYNDFSLYFLLDLGGFDPSGFCGQLSNLWGNPNSCYNFWGVYPGQQYGYQPPSYGCDFNWAFQEFYFYTGSAQNCGYPWSGGGWGGQGWDDFAGDPNIARLVVTKNSGAWRGEAVLARRQGEYHALNITICPQNGNCSANIKWISRAEVEQVKSWIRQIRQARRQSGTTQPPVLNCFAMPTQERTYTETQGLIKYDASPCGQNRSVPGAATDQLVGWMNSQSGL